MKMRDKVPVKAMTAVEPMRHGRLGGGELSAMRLRMIEVRESRRISSRASQFKDKQKKVLLHENKTGDCSALAKAIKPLSQP